MNGAWWAHTRAWHTKGHIRKVEATRRASRGMVIKREMAIAVCITPRGSNVSWVEDIAIDKGDLFRISIAFRCCRGRRWAYILLDLGVELIMSLLKMFLPEYLTFE